MAADAPATEPAENVEAPLPMTTSAAAAADTDTVAASTTSIVSDSPTRNTEPESAPAAENAASPPETTVNDKKWPGWPGDCVFRLIVPLLKVGSIIGRKGELIKKLCEETRARIRVLDGPVGTPDRVVLISGREEPDSPLSPAMDAAIRVFKRVTGLPESEGESKASGAAGAAYCSLRLLVATPQAINLIGKQGLMIKSIQESTGASVRVLSENEVPLYAASDERIIELQGEVLKVLKALEAVIGHLRKFLVDHSILPLFEKRYNTTSPQDRQVETWSDKSLLRTTSQTRGSDYPLSAKRDSLFLEHDSHMESRIPHSGLSIYGQEAGLSGRRSSGLGRAGAPIVTQVTQTMQIPLSYAEDIIGIGGATIAYIRRTSGALLTVQESRGLPDEITVEIKGTSSQVQAAQQLIQEFMSNHQETLPRSYGRIDAGHQETLPRSYGRIDTGLRSSYPELDLDDYPSSSLPTQSYGGGYGSSGVGGYSTYRL